MNTKHHINRAAVLTASVSLMFVAAPARAVDTVLLDIGQGTIVNDGAAVDVPVTFICPTTTDNQPVLNLEISQPVGGGNTARGGQGVVGFTCTGESQTITITVTASPKRGLFFFKVGKATAHAILNTCPADGSACTTVDRTQEIKFKK